MATIILAIAALFFAVKYLMQWVGSAALANWVLRKGYTPPTDEELAECSRHVWLQLLGRK